MTASPEYIEHLLDMLAGFGPVSPKRMFGGAGLFRDGLMFALIADDRLYFKADDGNRADFEAAGMGPFTYEKKGKPFALSYYEAPDDAMDDAEILAAWAAGAWRAALKANADIGAKSRRKKKKKKSKG